MKLKDSAERRPITILHCDLVNSTKLVDRLDPEIFLSVVEQFLDSATNLVGQYSGTVAGFTGDGIEAYFGYPVTTEQPAADAINAALSIRDSLVNNDLDLPHPLQCRIGVSTGVAVIGAPENAALGRRLMAFGSVAHLAERLQAAAQPEQVFIDAETRTLARNNFFYNEVGALSLKGFEGDVFISEVAGRRNLESRFDYSKQHNVDITGRQHVIELLVDRWKVATQGEGQVVHLIGEAGIGKSRSIHEFENRIAEQNSTTFRFQCSSQHVSSPMHPWLHNMQILAKLRQSDSRQQRRDKIVHYLSETLQLPEKLLDLTLSVMGMADQTQNSSVGAPPITAMSELLSYLVNLLVDLSRTAPIVVLFEDVQWIDATSRSGLDALVELARHESIFVGVTSRPGEQILPSNSYITTMSLVKLSKSEVREFIAKLVTQADGELPERVVDQIVSRADGNPLYIEELTSMFLDHSVGGTIDSVRARVPLTLQMSLLARLDRITRGRELAQIAAVLGDSFTIDQMKVLAKHERDVVRVGLEELVSSSVLRSIYEHEELRYEFRHSLLQDAVYESLLLTKRQQIHADIGHELESRPQDDVHSIPALRAYHFDCAGNWRLAFQNWVLAGERAIRSGATTEAIDLLEKAQRHSGKIRHDDELLGLLQRMHMAYGMAIMAVHGAVADPGAQFKLASELGEKLDNIELTVEALDWQFGVAYNSGQLDQCTEPAERLTQIGQTCHSPLPFMAGSQALGLLYFNQGRFQLASDKFEVLLEKEPNLISGQHCYPSISLSYYAWAKGMLGDSDMAITIAEKAIASASEESPHAYTIALSNCSYVFQSIGAKDLLEKYNRVLNEHCDASGEFMYSRRAMIMRDYLMAKRTQSRAYVDSMLENLDALLGAQEEVEITYLFSLLAEVQLEFAQYSEARQSLNLAMNIANRNGEMFCFAQLNRMMAEVAEHCPDEFDASAAEYYLGRASSIATQQGATTWLHQIDAHLNAIESKRKGAPSELH